MFRVFIRKKPGYYYPEQHLIGTDTRTYFFKQKIMAMDQATNQTTKTLKDLFSNPSELLGIITNPGKNGVAFFKSLSGQDKQYLAFAAGIGFIVYGIFLNRKKD